MLKDGELFFLAQPSGSVPLDEPHGLGLYWRDCRYLSGYELTIAGAKPEALVGTGAHGRLGNHQLANPDIRLADGTVIPKLQIGVHWRRAIAGDERRVHELLSFTNFGVDPVTLPVQLRLRAEFEDVFLVRELLAETPGQQLKPRWNGQTLLLAYHGADGLRRTVKVRFSLPPKRRRKASATFTLELAPQERKELGVVLELTESEEEQDAILLQHSAPSASSTHFTQRTDGWLAQIPEVQSDSLLLSRLVERSLADLRLLRSRVGEHAYFCAGLPWFGTLFGRDSLITAFEALSYDTAIAADTLRLLARWQGAREDEWRDEEPGKILHELRVGELARLGQIPHTPYYGTVDATPLFVMLVARHATATGSLELFDELRPAVDLALDWIDRYGDQNGDGYVEYRSRSAGGLVNQGWKDSGDAVVRDTGELAEPPISLVEVQAYVYAAKAEIAALFERAGDHGRAERLRREAQSLRDRFERDYWADELGFYSLALEAGGRPVRVFSSNPGHALWCGIVTPERARRVTDCLMSDELFGGWGIRTLSTVERRYNPVGYHVGTVWPHDNAIAAAGFKRYGFDREAGLLLTSIARAGMHFSQYRLPELFAGFSRAEFEVPVRYPIACHPQAWAAGAVPWLLSTALGLKVDGFERRLSVIRPELPDFAHHLRIMRIPVAGSAVSLAFERRRDGIVETSVLERTGAVDVHVEHAA